MAAGDGFAGDAGHESEVCGAGCVCGGDGGDVEFEVEGPRGDHAVVEEDGAVAEAGVCGKGRGVEDGGEVVGQGDEVVAEAGYVFEVVRAWEGHCGAPAFEWAGGDDLAVLPVGRPGNADLGFGAGDAVEELASIVVFAEVCDAGYAIDGREDGSVEGAGEVLRYGAAEGSAWVDADTEDIHCLGGVFHGDLDHVRAFVLQAEEAVVGEVGGVGPVFEIWGGIDSNDEVLGVGDHHYPFLGGDVPDHFRVAELGRVDGDDGVAGVFGEGEAAVGRVGDILDFFHDGVESVDGDDAVGLVGEEARGIVHVDDCGTGEDAFAHGAGVDGNLLVLPMVEIFGRSMTPVLISGHDVGWIVWYGLEVLNKQGERPDGH